MHFKILTFTTAFPLSRPAQPALLDQQKCLRLSPEQRENRARQQAAQGQVASGKEAGERSGEWEKQPSSTYEVIKWTHKRRARTS